MSSPLVTTFSTTAAVHTLVNYFTRQILAAGASWHSETLGGIFLSRRAERAGGLLHKISKTHVQKTCNWGHVFSSILTKFKELFATLGCILRLRGTATIGNKDTDHGCTLKSIWLCAHWWPFSKHSFYALLSIKTQNYSLWDELLCRG